MVINDNLKSLNEKLSDYVAFRVKSDGKVEYLLSSLQ